MRLQRINNGHGRRVEVGAPPKMVGAGTVLLHSDTDAVIPVADRREPVRFRALSESDWIGVRSDHRRADADPLRAKLDAFERAAHRKD